MRGLLVLDVGSYVSDVRIGQTNNLAGVTWIGENFLISGEAGIENDFTAAARNCACRAAVKYAPVFQRENRRSVLDFRQWVLLSGSYALSAHLVFASVVDSEPKWSTGQ